MAEKKDNTILWVLAGGVGIWIYLYWKKNGVMPWQGAPAAVSVPLGVSTTANAANTGAPTDALTAPIITPASPSQTLTNVTGDNGPGLTVIDNTSTDPATLVRSAATGNFQLLQSQGKIQTLTPKTQLFTASGKSVNVLTAPPPKNSPKTPAVSGVLSHRGHLGNICS